MAQAPQQLINYMVERMQEGHDLQDVKHALLAYGYNPSYVESAVEYIHKKRALDTESFWKSRSYWVAVSAAMVVLLVAATFFFQMPLAV